MPRGYRVIVGILIFALIFGGSVAMSAPRFVFFFIGDGMGEGDVHFLERYSRFRGVSSSFSALSFVGTVGTLSGGEIPDSASSGTALACGVKTRNGMLGVDPSGRITPSLAEIAKKRNFRVGIITNVAVNDATPASFYAHRSSRRDYQGIALDMVESGFDLLVGWGIASPGDALAVGAKRGYTVTRSWDDFLSRKDLPMVALLSFPFHVDRKNGYTLQSAVRRGIELLFNERGFLLVVEGGKIDWCKHMNDVGSLLGELLDFDEAIQEALTFAKQYPQETLVLVTADHETGEFEVDGEVDFPKILGQPFSYQVFFDRVSAGASLSEVAREMWGFPEELIPPLGGTGNDPNKAFIALARKFSQEVGVSWKTTGHTAEKVPVFVWGEQFPEKLHENTDIFPFLRRFIDDH